MVTCQVYAPNRQGQVYVGSIKATANGACQPDIMVGYVNVDGDVEDGIDVEDATGVDVNDVDADDMPENNCDANEDLEAGLKRDDSAD